MVIEGVVCMAEVLGNAVVELLGGGGLVGGP